MAGEWQIITLLEFCSKPNGGIQTGPFGSQLHRSDYVDVGVPVVMPTNIQNGRLAEEGIARISEAMADELKRHRMRQGDIIFSRRGEVDKCAVVTEREVGWLCGTGCLLARVDPKLADPRYIGYHIRMPETRAWLQQNAVGLVMPNLNTGILEGIPIHAPSRIEQGKIADLLASLDEKIDLNRQMAATLEEMTRALFKSWFVDFDPVHAKAQGHNTRLPADTAALFPDSFGDEGLPEGWTKLPFKAALELTKGNSYKSADLKPSNKALVTLKSFKRGGGYRLDGLKPFAGAYKPLQEVQPGDLIIAATDVTQAAEIVGQTTIVADNPIFEHLIASLDVIIARPKFLEPWFWNYLLKAQKFTELARNYTTGTTVLHLSKSVFDDFKFCVPQHEALLPLLRDCAKPVVEKAQILEQDCSALEQLRDTLLPKLLSGELRVTDAESRDRRCIERRMAYQLQLLRNLIERHPERAGNLELHVRALEQSIEQLPLTCLSNVRAMFEAMQHSVNGVLQITYGDDDDFPKRTSLVIKALDLSLGDHPQKDKIEHHLKKLLGSINGAASSLAALSNIPNLRHGGALDWPTLERQHAYMLGGLCDALVSFLLDVAWSRPSEDAEAASGPSYAQEGEFNDSLDSEYELFEIAGSRFEPSRILFTLDSTQYEAALTEWRLANPAEGEQEAAE